MWIYACIGIISLAVLPSCLGIEVNIGDEVTLNCSLDAQFPIWVGPASLATPLTSANGVVNQPGMEYVNDKNLKIANATTNHTGDYKCNDGSGEAMVRLDVNSFNVTIELGDASSNQVNFTYPSSNTTREEVKCVVSGAYPEPEVKMEFLGVTNVTSLDIQPTSTANLQSDNTYTVSLTWSLRPLEIIENKQIRCTVNFTQHSTEREETKSIYYRIPSPFLSFITSNPATWTDRAVRFVVESVSRPETTFEWGIPDPPVGRENYSYTISNPPCTMTETTLRFSCSSQFNMTKVQKVDNGLKLSYTYIYEGQKTKTDELQVSFQFPPTEARISGNTTVVVGSSGTGKATLTCSIDESTSGYIRWFKGNKTNKINSTYDEETTPGLYNANRRSQAIDIAVDRTMNGETIICCGNFEDTICNTANLTVYYPPEILAPQLTEYRAYMGDTLVIPCSIDSHPTASVQWWRETDTRANVTGVIHTDLLTLTLTNVTGTHTYRCMAWPESGSINESIFKEVRVIGVEKPSAPNVWPQAIGSGSYLVDVETSVTAPTVPRSFFVQYKKRGTDYWLEISHEIKDTIPGQPQRTERVSFTDAMLEANSKYDVRVRSVDANGLVLYSPPKLYNVGDTAQSKRLQQLERDVSDTYTYEEFRNAILISVFSTAGFFLIIIIILVCCIHHGHCQSSSSKSYAM